MIKKFFANVDDDKIHFLSIEVDIEGSPLDPIHIDKCYALSNNPSVLNITQLGYFPARKSVWNGISFVAPEGQDHKPPCIGACVNGCESIAFMINDVYYGGIGYCVGVSNNDMIIAALSSNPVITFEVE